MKHLRIILFLLLFNCVFSSNAEITLALYTDDKYSYGESDELLLVPTARFLQRMLNKYGKKFFTDHILKQDYGATCVNMIISQDGRVYYGFPADNNFRLGATSNMDGKKRHIEIMNGVLQDMTANDDTLFIVSDSWAISRVLDRLGAKKLPYKPSEEKYYESIRDYHVTYSGDRLIYEGTCIDPLLPVYVTVTDERGVLYASAQGVCGDSSITVACANLYPGHYIVAVTVPDTISSTTAKRLLTIP